MEWIVPSTGGAPVATVTLPAEASDVEWAPDGTSPTFLDGADDARNVFRQRVGGSKLERITRFTSGRTFDHRWSPDGRLLLSRRSEKIENLWVAAPDGGEPVQVTDFRTGRIFGTKWSRDGRRIVFTYGSETNDAVLIRNFR